MSLERHPILGWWGYVYGGPVYCSWWDEQAARRALGRAVLARLQQVYWEAES